MSITAVWQLLPFELRGHMLWRHRHSAVGPELRKKSSQFHSREEKDGVLNPTEKKKMNSLGRCFERDSKKKKRSTAAKQKIASHNAFKGAFDNYLVLLKRKVKIRKVLAYINEKSQILLFIQREQSNNELTMQPVV